MSEVRVSEVDEEWEREAPPGWSFIHGAEGDSGQMREFLDKDPSPLDPLTS